MTTTVKDLALDEMAKPERPEIKITTKVHETADQAEDLLNDGKTFQRGGSLVVIGSSPATEKQMRDAEGAPVITKCSLPMLTRRLSKAARWVKGVPRKEGVGEDAKIVFDWVPCKPPRDVIEMVLAGPEWSNAPPLTGILETPAMRADGSIVTEQGYDPETGYYAAFNIFPDVNLNPTIEDARAALDVLLVPFKDFPFAPEDARLVAVAAILTILARPALKGANMPMFVFDASRTRTGKTLLGDTVARIATGRVAAKMTFPKEPAEMEKILSSVALDGHSLISFDNVAQDLGGDALDKCLTSNGSIALRVLGKTQAPTVEWNTVIFASGNNVMMCGDTPGRAIVCRQESDLEHPEDRQGLPDLAAYVAANREKLLGAALTLLRAGVLYGQGAPVLGGFEQWSKLVGGSIYAVTGKNVLDFKGGDDADSDKDKLLSLISYIEGEQKCARLKESFSAKELASSTTRLEAEGIIPPNCKSPTNYVARLLRAFKDRVINQRKITSKMIHGTRMWAVSRKE